MEAEIPFNPELHISMDISTFIENNSGAILGALEASTPKRRPIGDQRPQIPASIQDEIRSEKPAAETVAGLQGPRSENRCQPPSEVGDQTAQ